MTISASYSHRQSGQVLLIVVLIMVVALTVGLSLVSRTIINVKTSTDTSNSQNAFSAAEAGIEQALQQGSKLDPSFTIKNTPIGSFSNISALSVQDVGGPGDTTSPNPKSLNLNNGDIIHQDEGIDLYLSDVVFSNPYPAGTMTIYWGTPGGSACSDAAIEAITISGTAANKKVTSAQAIHDAFDPCPSGNRASTQANHFTTATTGSKSITYGGITTMYAYSAQIALPTNGFLMHIVPLYADTKIGVVAPSGLPLQGQIITSTGTSGGTQRKISLYQSNGQIPAEMFYTLFVPQ